MAARHLDLLFKQVEVVEEPLGGMGYAPGLTCRLGRTVVGSQNLFVLIEPRQQSVRTWTRDEMVMLSQRSGVPHQLLHPKELGPQRRFICLRVGRRGLAPEAEECFHFSG